MNKCESHGHTPSRQFRELAAETATKPSDAVRSSITELQKGLATVTSRISELRQIVIVGAIILAILIYFRVKY